MDLSCLSLLGIDAPSLEVTSVVSDNRDAREGSLFAGVPGERVHGAIFASDAVARGAVAVLTDEEGESLADVDVPVIVTSDVPGILGQVAALVYDEPASKLTSFAVTGTNGKTTTTFIIDHILTRLGHTTGLIGTVELKIAGSAVPARLTTPQPADLQSLLADLVQAGGTDVVMEVSSHAMAQRRTSPVRFSVAGFTNLTQDHLDYHASLEEYFQAKASLFDPATSDNAVIWTDDPYGQRLYESLENAVWVGRTKQAGRGYLVSGGSDFTIRGAIDLDGHTDLPGDFNVANTALALAMLAEAGVEGLASVCDNLTPVVPGRMEVISTRPRVIVDFAHNADALERAITSLADSTPGRLITVTGSAGDRDKEKRPVMGRIAAALSDLLIVTDDDPHGEDPAIIRSEVMAGALGHGEVIEIGERAEAIAHAIAIAGPEDTVLLAGRGHETIQEIAGVDHHLDDREEARAALAHWKDES